jgi:hypothetical protein
VGDVGCDCSETRDTDADREPRWTGGAGKSNCDSLRIFLSVFWATAAELGTCGTVRSVEVVPNDNRDVSWAKAWPDVADALEFRELVRGLILGAFGTGGAWLDGNIWAFGAKLACFTGLPRPASYGLVLI